MIIVNIWDGVNSCSNIVNTESKVSKLWQQNQPAPAVGPGEILDSNQQQTSCHARQSRIYSPSEYIIMSNISPEFALLGFLIAEPSHGYDLHQKFQTELGSVWHLSQSQAYAILKRLEARGDISSQLVEQDKLPARQILHITPTGKRRFEEWLNDAGRNARAIRLEFLTRLYFTLQYHPDQTAHVYEQQCVEIRGSIERLESLLTHLPPDQTYNHLSLDLRLRQLRLIQDWMREIQAQFDIPTETIP
jgi:DNA-binding PadR family transcriptional regulator